MICEEGAGKGMACGGWKREEAGSVTDRPYARYEDMTRTLLVPVLLLSLLLGSARAERTALSIGSSMFPPSPSGPEFYDGIRVSPFDVESLWSYPWLAYSKSKEEALARARIRLQADERYLLPGYEDYGCMMWDPDWREVLTGNR
jgi:hypothetical protein